MNQRYASKFNTETEARALGKDLPVSTKHSIEICSMIRGRPLDVAKKMLEEVMALRKAVPFKRFNMDVGHKKGKMAAGRYPVKASGAILDILKLAEANAQNKGLGGTLTVRHVLANQASRPMKYGRQQGQEARRTHVEVILTEIEGKKTREPKREKEITPTKPAEKEEVKEMSESKDSDHDQKSKISDEPIQEAKVEKKEEPVKKEVKEEKK